MNKLLIYIVVILFHLPGLSQQQPDININSSVYFSSNIEYNTGEVFVIFTINNESIVSRPQQIVETPIPKAEETSQSATDIIIIYPNPTSDLVYIQTDKKEITKLFLYDENGRLIVQQKYSKAPIDLSTFEKGTYILKTNLNDTSFKIIKK